MWAALIAAIMAIIAAIILELVKRPFRSAYAWAGKWARLIRQLPQLDQAVERLAAARAHEYSNGYDWQYQDCTTTSQDGARMLKASSHLHLSGAMPDRQGTRPARNPAALLLGPGQAEAGR